MKKVTVSISVLLAVILAFVAGMFFENSKQKQESPTAEPPSSFSAKRGQIIYYNGKHQVIGADEEIKLISWKMIKGNDELSKLLEVTFEFKNKTNQEAFLEDFAISRIRIGLIVNGKYAKSLTTNLASLASTTIPAHQTGTGKISAVVPTPYIEQTNNDLRQLLFIFQVLAKDNVEEGLNGLSLSLDRDGSGGL